MRDFTFILLCILVFMSSFLLSGCNSGYDRIERSQDNKCETPQDRKALADFIVKCSEAANPKSDEEGEDLVKQCEWTGVRTLCPTVETCRRVQREEGFMTSPYWSSWGSCNDKN